uniref:Probable serine/threonine-protein kinase At1g54610 n=1 Tax=Nicotiana sylvestris TaxID=4096 RepID=A0A1U7YEN6_NICSY
MEGDELVDGWPKWLVDNIPKEVLVGLVPKTADSYDKLAKVGQGTYSNVYKAKDRKSGKIVALKKVRFDTSEPESVKFMAREIIILKKVDHPNIIKLEGLATSRMQYSLYLVFDFMESDLTKLINRTEGRLTEPQVKRYMEQQRQRVGIDLWSAGCLLAEMFVGRPIMPGRNE